MFAKKILQQAEVSGHVKTTGRRRSGVGAGKLQNKYAVYGCKTITMCNDPKLNTEQTENAVNYDDRLSNTLYKKNLVGNELQTFILKLF